MLEIKTSWIATVYGELRAIRRTLVPLVPLAKLPEMVFNGLGSVNEHIRRLENEINNLSNRQMTLGNKQSRMEAKLDERIDGIVGTAWMVSMCIIHNMQ
jgi:t-SNARE complex subunit (syntaxin)